MLKFRVAVTASILATLLSVGLVHAQWVSDSVPSGGAAAASTGPTISGTPVADQLAYWATASALAGNSNFTRTATATDTYLSVFAPATSGSGNFLARGSGSGEWLQMGNYGSSAAGSDITGIANASMRFIRARHASSGAQGLVIYTETVTGTNVGAPIYFGWISGAPSNGIMLTLTPTGNLATFTGKVTANTMAVTGTTKGTCTLNGASPATCTATVPTGCLPICGRATAAHLAPGCTVATTTLTATGANGETDVVNFWCPQ